MARNAEIQIGELSRRTGCNIETIRYYERIGMLPPPPRSASRYRLYEAGDVHRLTFVRRARELGFSLDEVRALLALSADTGNETCVEVRELAVGHLWMFRRRLPISARWSVPLFMLCAVATQASRPVVP
jgi:MerR family transcriptional regulator, mercuric resistance operon regulatory protein